MDSENQMTISLQNVFNVSETYITYTYKQETIGIPMLYAI